MACASSSSVWPSMSHLTIPLNSHALPAAFLRRSASSGTASTSPTTTSSRSESDSFHSTLLTRFGSPGSSPASSAPSASSFRFAPSQFL